METLHIKRILVPIDFSDTSLKALDEAIYMAKLTKATLTLLHVAETVFPMDLNASEHYAVTINNLSEHEQEVFKRAAEYLKKLKTKLHNESEVEVNTIATAGWVKDEILDTAEKIKADIIVMGTHGVKGFKEFILGSNTFRVVNEADIPVISVQKHTETPGFKKILVPFRDKPHSREKVDPAIYMAKLYGATIQVLGIDTGDTEQDYNKIEREANQIKRIVESHDVNCEVDVRTTDYLSDKILKYAEERGSDLIVIMAQLDRESVSELFMGPLAQQIVNHSKIPVLSIEPAINPEMVDFKGYGWTVGS